MCNYAPSARSFSQRQGAGFRTRYIYIYMYTYVERRARQFPPHQQMYNNSKLHVYYKIFDTVYYIMSYTMHLLNPIYQTCCITLCHVQCIYILFHLQCIYSIWCTGWSRSISCIIFIGHVPQKSPIISGFLAKRDLQLGARQAEEL